MNLNDITYKINGCAMKVHNTLGNGFQEVIYQRCLALEDLKKSLLQKAFEGELTGSESGFAGLEDVQD